VIGTGLTGVDAASALVWVTRLLWPGDPGLTKLSRRRVIGVKGYERLNSIQLTNCSCVVTKFGMSLTKFLIEQSALFEKFEISSTI
jgi:hypothetical protein